MIPGKGPAPHILLAEDNPADVYLIDRALRQHGVSFDLEVAETGRLALAMIRNYSQAPAGLLPSLIVLDLNLPQHDGIEILQSIRQADSISEIPVVVLTSSDSPRDHMRSLECGATRYVRKPSNLDDFMVIGGMLKELLVTRPDFALHQ